MYQFIKSNTLKYIPVITAVLAIFISILTYINTIRQNDYDNEIKKMHSLIEEGNLNLSTSNYEISKMNSFSSLMSQFVKGTIHEKEVALILMIQIDSVLAYNIMDRLASIQDENIQPALKNALENEANRIRKVQSTISDPDKLKRVQKNNRPKEILRDLNKNTTNKSMKDETNKILVNINYCDDISLAQLFFEKKFYDEAITLFQEIAKIMPNDKKLSNVYAARIKISMESGQIEKACELYSEAFKDYCR